MQKLKALSVNLKDRIFFIFLSLVGLFIGLAFLTQVLFIVLEFSGHTDILTKISNELIWRFDGTFKNDPKNIFYNADEHI